MSKEAMKLALEGAANYIDTLGGDSRKYRQALANEALERMAENARELGLNYDVKSDHRLMDMPAQQEQEPFCYHDGHNIVGKEFADHSDVFPLYTRPQAREPEQQEPVIPYGDNFPGLQWPDEIDPKMLRAGSGDKTPEQLCRELNEKFAHGIGEKK